MRSQEPRDLYKYMNHELLIDFKNNLNPLGPPKELIELINGCMRSRVWTRYPDPNYLELRVSIASFYGLNPSYVVPCSCVSEAINLVIIAAKPDTVITVAPVHGVPEFPCTVLGIKLRYVLMREAGNNFEISMESLAKYVRSGGKYVIVIINPNDPTGTYLPPKEILSLAAEFKNSLFIINEAYVELSGMSSLANYNIPENIIIVRTFTKLLAAPGLGLSFTYCNCRSLTEVLNSLRPAWNISSICDCVYTRLLRDHAIELKKYLNDSIKYVREWRNYLVEHLRSLGLKIFDSVANYVLIKHSGIDARYLHKILARKYGIIIQPAHIFYGLGMEYSRFSVRHPRYCNVLLKALENVLKIH